MMRTAILFGTLSAGALLVNAVWRPRMAKWGTTADEFAKPLPGDELFPDTRIVSTRAITIDAPPARVWPWLVQMGHGRAGFYSHDWVERLLGMTYAEGRSATRILPEFQELALGDRVPYHSWASMEVVRIDPPHVLIAGEWFVLEERDGGRSTRLIVRTRGGWLETLARDNRLPWPFPLASGLVDRFLGEPLHHYMETGMLKGLKARVEALR